MEGKKEYVCTHCGIETSVAGHLCHPREIEKVCEFCEIPINSERHICKPKLEEMKWVCQKCGRVAVESYYLCDPVKITEHPA